jgi:hypothetical protein
MTSAGFAVVTISLVLCVAALAGFARTRALARRAADSNAAHLAQVRRGARTFGDTDTQDSPTADGSGDGGGDGGGGAD